PVTTRARPAPRFQSSAPGWGPEREQGARHLSLRKRARHKRPAAVKVLPQCGGLWPPAPASPEWSSGWSRAYYNAPGQDATVRWGPELMNVVTKGRARAGLSRWCPAV